VKRTPLENWISEKIGCKTGLVTREAIERFQVSRLKETLALAVAASPFYKGHLAGFDMASLESIEDLKRLPFTTPEDLRRNPLSFLCVSQGKIQRVVTSGTTGEAKRLYFTREDQELTVDFFRVGMSTLVGRGTRVLILLPGERPGSVGDLLAAGLDRLGANGMVYGPVRDYAHVLETIAREKINALVGIPIQVLTIARTGRGMVPPESALLSTDYVPAAITAELKRIWGCEVYAHYGMTEMGYGGGVECRAGNGYHMREADLLFEIVDPKTGTPWKEGESGEVVFTTLTRRGMPLIRYRTGDLSRFLPDRCPCGTVLRTMAPVEGRIADQVELEPGIMLGIPDLDEALFPIHNLVDFSAELTWKNERSCLEIKATLLEEKGEEQGGILNALHTIPAVRSLAHEGKLLVGVTVREGTPEPLSGSTKRTIVVKRG